MQSPKTVLLTDARHILTSDLRWLSPDGQVLPVAGPPEPEVKTHAELHRIPRGVRLVAQKPQKSDPLPKESRFTRAIQDGGVYRSWYLHTTYAGEDLGSYARDKATKVEVVYTESNDAFVWQPKHRCEVPLLEYTGFDGFGFFVDPHGPASERYKIVYGAKPPERDRAALWAKYDQLHPRYRDGRLTAEKIYCIYALVSPDGLNWAPVREPLMVHQSDTDTTVVWNDYLQRYVMYTRLYPRQRRTIGIAEAEDFYRWGPVEPLIGPRLDWTLTDDIYLNAYSEYPGSPTYRLMFPMIYHRYDQTSEIRMYASDDGLTWHEVPGGPIITPGGPDAWDAEFITAGKDLVFLGPERIGIPYHGTPYPHKYPRWKSVSGRVAWATWPKGRLCALTADQEGEFYTFPLVPAGRALRLNINVRRGGVARVGVADVPGRAAADCTPIIGNGFDLPVAWNGQTDIGTPDGQPVTLHFQLRAAELFGFEWV